MFDRIRSQVLRALRVPPDPEPPAGGPGSLRVFRGGRNLYKLRLVRWGLGQLGALIGIGVSLYFLDRLEKGHAEITRETRAAQAAAAVAATTPEPAPEVSAPVPDAEPAAAKSKSKSKLSPDAKKRTRTSLARMAEKWPWWIFPLLKLLEFGGIVLYVIQIPLTHAMVRLDYELRWYLVTDRSLRIRTGLATVRESTMSFANVQQVVVTQGPLQRLLAIADVRVQSAGGAGDHHEGGAGESLHTGVFHGVDNAHEIRDLILERLRRFRETGLGDPDEPTGAARIAPPSAESSVATPVSSALAAARELLTEARELRRVLR